MGCDSSGRPLLDRLGMNATMKIAGNPFEHGLAMIARYCKAVLFLAICALAAACQGGGSKSHAGLRTGSTTPQAADTGDLTVVAALAAPKKSGGANSVRISQNDLLKVDVFQVDDLDRVVRVGADGMISMPLIGSVRASGSTVPQFERSLEAKYGARYLQSPEITVFVQESFGQRVTMDGEFIKPGIYPISSQTTLLRAVAQAGGLTRLADEGKVYVYRQHGGDKQVANYSVTDIRNGKKSDPKLYGGDVVVSFTSGTKVALQNLRQALGLATSASRVATPF